MVSRRPTLDQLPTKPNYLTNLGSRYPDGRCRSSMDSSVWLYRAVPLAPVVDARDNKSQLEAMDPLERLRLRDRFLARASSTMDRKRSICSSCVVGQVLFSLHQVRRAS